MVDVASKRLTTAVTLNDEPELRESPVERIVSAGNVPSGKNRWTCTFATSMTKFRIGRTTFTTDAIETTANKVDDAETVVACSTFIVELITDSVSQTKENGSQKITESSATLSFLMQQFDTISQLN